MGRKCKTLYTIWVAEYETNKLIKRTKISFKDKAEARQCKANLNDKLIESGITDYRYIILQEDTVVYKHATDITADPNTLTF